MKTSRKLALALLLSFLLTVLAGSGLMLAMAEETAKEAAEPAEVSEDMAYLPGEWGEIKWIRNGPNNPFYLDCTVKDATWVEFYMTTPFAPRGYPYGEWYLYAMDEKGNWDHVAKFALDKSMTQGKTVKVRLALDGPSTFKGLTVTSVESGMDFTLWRFIDFYTDPECVPEDARGAQPESLEKQFEAYKGKEPPLTKQTVSYGEYGTPGGFSPPETPTDYPPYPPIDYPPIDYPPIDYPPTNYPPGQYPPGTVPYDGTTAGPVG